MHEGLHYVSQQWLFAAALYMLHEIFGMAGCYVLVGLLRGATHTAVYLLTLKLTRRRVWALVRGRFGLPVPVACCRRAPLSLFCCEGDRLLLAGLPRAPLWRTSESCPYRCRRLIWLDLGDMEAQQRTALLAALRPVEVSALRGAAASDNAADRNGK